MWKGSCLNLKYAFLLLPHLQAVAKWLLVHLSKSHRCGKKRNVHPHKISGKLHLQQRKTVWWTRCYTYDALNVCHESHQLLCLTKHAATPQLICMWNVLKKPQQLWVCITALQLIKISEKMKYLTSKNPGPKLNKPINDVKLYIILLCVLPDTIGIHLLD